MSIELHIFMQDSRVPTRVVWQQAIERIGFPVLLDSNLDVREHRGFCPATFRGQSAGFEFHLEPATETMSAYPQIAPRVGNREKCAIFRWGGNLLEMGSALAAAACLTEVTDGVYFYPEDELVYGAAEAVEATRRDLNSI
jgi:hypothetical protein